MKNQKIAVFIDFDGVLINEASLAIWWESSKGSGVFDKFSPENLLWFRSLCRTIHPDVWVSSSWRKRFSFDEIRDFLIKKIGIEIAGFTPVLKSCRGYEIQAVLETEKPDDYIIIDDIADFLPYQEPRFIKVDSSVGFRKADFNKARRILSVTTGDTRFSV